MLPGGCPPPPGDVERMITNIFIDTILGVMEEDPGLMNRITENHIERGEN